jgi:hypothetical protein
MTTDDIKTISLRSEDRHLVDLLATVLVDPGIHTDTRLHLYHDIEQILRAAHEDLHGAAGPDMHRRALKVHQDWLPDVLESVLVDPNLHTDTRMRLHHEIAETLSTVARRA